MSLRLVLTAQQYTITLTQLQTFVLEHEAYTPYTQLSLTAYGTYDENQCLGVYRVALYSDDTLLHLGTVEQLEVCREKGVQRLRLSSRGLTAMLLQNQLEPGLHGNMSLDKLMTDFYTFPSEITWEPNGDTSNYLYVKANASMWDGVANLTYKLYGRYPFIRGANHLCMNLPESYSSLHLNEDSTLVRWGVITDQSLVYSDYYMAGADGTYGTFHVTDEAATSRQLVRTKQLALDQQYLYDPPQALHYRCKFADRRLVRYYAELAGLRLLLLGDRLTIADRITAAPITRVRITGDGAGIRTRLEAYDDPFYPMT